MKALSFAVLILCVLVMLDMAECRRPRKRKLKKQQQRSMPVIPASQEVTTRQTKEKVSAAMEAIVAAGACHVICEGDSVFLEDSCSCGCLQSGYGYNSRSGQCQDIDECQDESMCQGGMCVNTIGSYHCTCPSGYNLHANGKVCLAAPKVILPCRGLQCFGESSLDENRCRCKCDNPGMTYDYFKEDCVDIDECAEGIANCQDVCVNSIGSFQCHCYHGFRLNYDRVSCDPVDPNCKDSTPFCKEIASAIECMYNPSIRDMCQKSCRVCLG